MILECNNCGSTEDTDHHCWVNNVAWNVFVTEQGYLCAEMDDHEERCSR